RVRLSGRIRPLLAGKDMLAGLQELLDRRSPFYQRCRSTLDVTGMPADAACGEVVKLARSLGGW
ncbi:MAG TPA: hypothetical protein VD793_07100, partial [Gemmatimonadales bacterium]|nr:hypothetical protein [Gemmatimonadales bacterium]